MGGVTEGLAGEERKLGLCLARTTDFEQKQQQKTMKKLFQAETEYFRNPVSLARGRG